MARQFSCVARDRPFMVITSTIFVRAGDWPDTLLFDVMVDSPGCDRPDIRDAKGAEHRQPGTQQPR